MDFLAGILGFIGFECLKIYKVVWGTRKSFPPLKWLPLYIISLLGLGVLSGFTAMALAPNNLPEAIFIGFSIPNGIKTIFEPRIKVASTSNIYVDDIDLQKQKVKQSNFLSKWYNLVFYLLNRIDHS